MDLGNAAILPGLVNSHCHLELTVFRGLLEDLSFRDWIVALQSAKQAVTTPERFLDSARLGIEEGLLAGVTCFADTCDSGVVLGAMRDAGVRGIMYQEVFGPDPARRDASLAELRQKLRAHRALETPLVRAGVSPHAPYTVSDPLFTAVAEFAREERLPMAIHVAESEAEQSLISRASGAFADGLRARGIDVAVRGQSPLALLAALGVLDLRPLLIHCVRADAADISLVASHACAVAHCPASNAKFGHGIAPLVEMLDAGIAVGLGSDSVASNNLMDILGEARLAVLGQRARTLRFDALSAVRALRLATLGGATALGIADRVGSLEVGKQADLAAFALDDAGSTPVYDPIATLVYSLGARPARLVAVAGQELVRDGRLVRQTGGLRARVADTAALLASFLTRSREGVAGR
ncbi:MAG: amidohydrolase family protein [Gemmatimonadota bacterium]|nr:amidohydrolase family protein [Gemmatimonadota bacterium]